MLVEKRQAMARTWDARACPSATLNDLSQELFALTYRRAAVDPNVIEENHRPIEQQLAALRMYQLRSPSGPTHAGVLTLGLDPLEFVPGAYVQYVAYAGDNMAVVERQRRFTGDLATQLRGLDELAESLAGSRPVQEGLAETVVHDDPPQALHELFVNAVIHRDFESTAPVSIVRFPDRVEIKNPGGLYAMSPTDFPDLTSYRNPVLAEAAKVLGFANRFGRGVGRAQHILRDNGSPDAAFDLREGFINVVVRKRS